MVAEKPRQLLLVIHISLTGIICKKNKGILFIKNEVSHAGTFQDKNQLFIRFEQLS
jgi:hypothetical protein